MSFEDAALTDPLVENRAEPGEPAAIIAGLPAAGEHRRLRVVR